MFPTPLFHALQLGKNGAVPRADGMLLEGADVNLNTTNENILGFSLAPVQ